MTVTVHKILMLFAFIARSHHWGWMFTVHKWSSCLWSLSEKHCSHAKQKPVDKKSSLNKRGGPVGLVFKQWPLSDVATSHGLSVHRCFCLALYTGNLAMRLAEPFTWSGKLGRQQCGWGQSICTLVHHHHHPQDFVHGTNSNCFAITLVTAAV